MVGQANDIISKEHLGNSNLHLMSLQVKNDEIIKDQFEIYFTKNLNIYY